MTSTYTLPLPWTTPPLTENQRMHWRKKAAVVASVRQTAALVARSTKLPRNVAHARISLHYRPRDNRRRDADNLVPTLKAICDGLVDYGLTPDDTPQEMTKDMPTIHPKAAADPAIWIEIRIERTQEHQ